MGAVIDLDALPPLREVIARHGLAARHSLGQHFLLDRNLTDRIAREAGPLTGATVIEIGPGPGGLTRSLLATDAAQVVAIERDARCVAALRELEAAAAGRLTLVADDALAVDTAALCRSGGPCVIVANLPYNIATALLVRWLHRIDAFASLTLMFQKEVADRLTAPPGGKAYGRLSVLTQWLTEPKRLFTVPARAFVPPPKVESAVVRLAPRAAPLAPAAIATLERVTAAAFGQRRKMLRASLKSLGGDTAALIAAAGVTPTARAEDLSVAEFCALARALDAAGKG
ncbi:MAG: 16S rRNA (adenine(1518)-N(6)/adenine(1519)-N(6))-dimethyltransferase RsmA [Candidatus Eiseniibacteriota bacterium]